jgi:thioredoxin 1
MVDETRFKNIVRSVNLPLLVSVVDNRLGPCRMCAPDVYEVAREFEGSLLVLMVDANQYPALAIELGGGAGPHFIVLREGSVFQQHCGSASKTEMERWIRAVIPERREPAKSRSLGLLSHLLRLFSMPLIQRSTRSRSIVHAG